MMAHPCTNARFATFQNRRFQLVNTNCLNLATLKTKLAKLTAQNHNIGAHDSDNACRL